MSDTIRDSLIRQCVAARRACYVLAASGEDTRSTALRRIADALEEQSDVILAANEKDMLSASDNGVRDTMLDRLRLDKGRIASMANGVRKVASLPDPLGKGEVWRRPNGLDISRVRVPIGVIGIIYEARPNVTADAAALCVKSGNAVVLRGGKAALNSNAAIVSVISDALNEAGLDGECVQLISDSSRDSVNVLLRLNGYVDLLIPRGGAGLIKSVVENSSIPVIETGAGNCHVYVDASADVSMAVDITFNAKCQRPSVCNSAETLLVHRDIASAFLPEVKKALDKKDTQLYGCPITCSIIPCEREATEEDWYEEYNDYKLAIKVVNSVAQAVEHINKYSTKHSESIVTSDMNGASYFTQNVDAAAVYVNASTRFTDGEEFGFGAEIGISTGKLHARGPMGLEEMTTIKYIVHGSGQIR
ncbi:MAG: glutamate-5-semialdehyde dehydrogenase [Eubacteriales bacterium]